MLIIKPKHKEMRNVWKRWAILMFEVPSKQISMYAFIMICI